MFKVSYIAKISPKILVFFRKETVPNKQDTAAYHAGILNFLSRTW